MGVRWQACWTVTTGDTVDWYEYDRCLRGFSYPLRKPATADCARSPDAQAACSLPCCRADPPSTARTPAQSRSTSTPRPHAVSLDGLDSYSTRYSGQLARTRRRQARPFDSPSTAGQRLDGARRASADTRSSSPHAPARRVGDRGACRVAGSSTARRSSVSAVTQRGGESNYLDSHTIPST